MKTINALPALTAALLVVLLAGCGPSYVGVRTAPSYGPGYYAPRPYYNSGYRPYYGYRRPPVIVAPPPVIVQRPRYYAPAPAVITTAPMPAVDTGMEITGTMDSAVVGRVDQGNKHLEQSLKNTGFVRLVFLFLSYRSVDVTRQPTPLNDFRPGDMFANRADLALSGLHRPRRAGISGTMAGGAESVVLSGVYEDDIDSGDVVWYAGHGGHDPKSGHQTADQLLDRYNLALMRSYETAKPIRLIRGATLRNEFAPAVGYRYEGLYRIEAAERIQGKSGFWIWLFKLVALKSS